MRLVAHSGIFANGLLKPGIYKVKLFTIEKILKPAKDKRYSDPTPQIKIRFIEEQGKRFIVGWYPLKGYQRTVSGEYAIKDGQRIENANRTSLAKNYLRNLFLHAGINKSDLDVDDYLTIQQLKGKYVRVCVIEYEDKVTIDYTMPAEELADENRELERKKKCQIISILFQKLQKKTPREAINQDKYWHGNTFDRLYDMDLSELENMEKLYGLTIISRSFKSGDDDENDQSK